MTKDIITRKQLEEQMQQFSHCKGKIVTVHASLKAVGEIEGGGETLLNVLIDYFTQNGGLLCIPTHTWNSLVYDRRKNDTCVGVLPRLAAGHPDAVRTLHPTHSMAVFGDREKVAQFVKDEAVADTPANPNGCYGKLLADNGYILLIGIGQEKNTFIHCVEEMLDVPDRLTDTMVERTIIHKDGREEKRFLHWFDSKILDVSVFFPKFEKPFRYHGCIEDAFIGNAKVQLCSAGKIHGVIKMIYENNNFGELLDNDLPIDEKLYK